LRLTLELLKLSPLPLKFAVLLFNLLLLIGLLNVTLLHLISHQGPSASTERSANRRTGARTPNRRADDRPSGRT